MNFLHVAAILLAVTVIVVAVIWDVRAKRGGRGKVRGAKPGRSTPAQPEQWGVRIAAPDNVPTCAAVREVLGKEFPLATKPPLPLANCPYPHQCACRYIKLYDRRQDDRRGGHDRRVAGQRFEKDRVPRRSGQDRRTKIDWY
jgi:hypothetical protein